MIGPKGFDRLTEAKVPDLQILCAVGEEVNQLRQEVKELAARLEALEAV